MICTDITFMNLPIYESRIFIQYDNYINYLILQFNKQANLLFIDILKQKNDYSIECLKTLFNECKNLFDKYFDLLYKKIV